MRDDNNMYFYLFKKGKRTVGSAVSFKRLTKIALNRIFEDLEIDLIKIKKKDLIKEFKGLIK
jgi:hypothetical protein